MSKDTVVITHSQAGDSFSVSAAPTEQLLAKQLDLLVSLTPKALSAAYLVALLCTVVYWNLLPHLYLVGWLLGITVLSVTRLLLCSDFKRRETALSGQDMQRWLGRYRAYTLIAGALWGLASLQFNVGWPLEYQVFVLFILAGLSAGAISSHGIIFSSYLLFLVPLIFPLSLAMLLSAAQNYVTMGILLVVYAISMAVTAHIHSRAIRRSFSLALENQRLISGMSSTNKRLRQEVVAKQSVVDQLRREQRLFLEGPVVTYRVRAEDNWPIEYISRSVRQFGLNPDRLIQSARNFADLIHPDDREKVSRAQYVQPEDGSLPVLEIDYRLQLPDGRVRWVYDCSTYVVDEQSGEKFYDGYLIDITSRKSVEHALIEEKERAQVTLQSIGDGVITTDCRNLIRFMNPAAEELTGWTLEEARGRIVTEVYRLADDALKKTDMQERRQKPGGKFWDTLGDHQLLSRRDGGIFYGKSVISRIRGEDGELFGSVIVFHDVTDQRKLTEHLSYQASHDALTGLINRQEFERVVEAALQTVQKGGGVHSLCYIDLDQFKVVNDTSGHDAGDELLKHLAYGVSQLLRDTDVLARLGGDEFGLLLEDCNKEKAFEIADSIRAFIKDNRFVWEGSIFDIGASIGIVEITAESENVGKLMSAADIACYAAKDNGRNQVHVYHGEESEPGKRHNEIQLVTRITRALEENTLVLYFQEIRSLSQPQSQLPYGEILVRMKDDQGGIISPGLFIPAAERYNLMPSIDAWVIDHTLDWCQQKLESGHEIGRLSVNLSGHSLGNEHFCSDVIDLFTKHDVSPAYICFEITETAAISNFSSASRFIRRLKERGCQFALDDFGSGLSSFSYLKNLSVDYLKIDGSFIQDIANDVIDREMVKSIHQLGRVMGMKTIAEFVENDDILAEINAIGIDYAQGYGIARPIPIECVFSEDEAIEPVLCEEVQE